jgi:hypothetical protein
MGNGGEVRPEIEESGIRLATFQRKGFARDNRPDVELRVVLDDYEGKRFVTVRQWERCHGRFAPTKRGTSIRMGEIRGLIGALERALDEPPVEGPGRPAPAPRDDPPRFRRTRESRRDQPPTRRPAAATAPLPGVEPEPVDEFDEFRRHPKGRPTRG